MKTHALLCTWLTIAILVTVLPPLPPSPRLLASNEAQVALATMCLGHREQMGTISTLAADTDPPAPVTDLFASTSASPGEVDLSWIAPGDDGTAGTATAYIVRYNSAPITESNWAASTDVEGEPAPMGTWT